MHKEIFVVSCKLSREKQSRQTENESPRISFIYQ